MFWRKKSLKTRDSGHSETVPADVNELSQSDLLERATSELATSLRSYSEAAFRASLSAPDEELRTAQIKLRAARELVTESRLAFALGRCIPEHIQYWSSWILRENFADNVLFDASDIKADRIKEKDGKHDVDVSIVRFVFNGNNYRVVLRDKGTSHAPGASDRLGEIELSSGDFLLAQFEIYQDYDKEYPEWEFRDVRALIVGDWMQDILDIAAQIQTRWRKKSEEYQNKRTLEAARKIDLGKP